MMTCSDAEHLLDAFVDSELPPVTLLEVARHAGQCGRCGSTVNELLGVRQAVATTLDELVAGLDLSTTWPRVEAVLTRTTAQAAWRHRLGAARRRMPRSAPVWGSLAALAASAALFLRAPVQQVVRATGDTPRSAARVATKKLPNHMYIDRLAGKDIALRREPKSGTMVIWVNHEVGDTAGW